MTPSRHLPLTSWTKPGLVTALVIASIILFALVAQRFLWDYALGEAASDSQDALNRDAFQVQGRLRGRANDMFFLKNVAESELARNPQATPASSYNLRSAIITMMLARSQFDKIFLLDLQGREILRYNWVGGDKPIRETPLSEFQDKSDRPFFQETVKAAAAAAVYSPLELTFEHGKIVQPYKPVVRVSGQIVGPDGKPRALLVLNYQAEALVKDLRHDTNKSHRSFIINPDGFWIVGPTPTSEWAYMFPERKNESLAVQDPAFWKKVTSVKEGWFDENGSLIDFENIDPINDNSDYTPLRVPVRGSEYLHWTLLQKTPNAAIWQNVHSIRTGIWITCATAILVFAPITWIGVSGRERRRHDELAVREAHDLLNSVNDASPHGLVVLEAIRDRAGKVIDLRLILHNRAANDLLGRDLSLDLARNKTTLQIRPAASSDGSFERYVHVIETGEPAVFELLYQHDKVERWLSVRGAKYLDGLVVTFVDVTAHKRDEEELRQSQARLMLAVAHEQELARQAQAAERAKGEFLAIMSHEIRTPMNGVIGMTSILADTGLNDIQRDCVHTIQVSGEALLTVINDILDFSKIESGKMVLEQRSFNLRQCIEDVISLFVARIREKKLETIYFIAPEVPANLIGDAVRLRQILTNLIGNALKFTERGEIVLNVRCQSRDSQGCQLLFSIADTGIGIPSEAIGKLFQSFQQVDTSTTRRYGGTGLGLAISKRLAELMHGTMWVESEPGAGSTFSFSVIMEAAPLVGGVETEPGRALRKPCKALIVDDNAANRRVLDMQLHAWGIDSSAVTSGDETLRRLDGEKFDVVLIDLLMPEMDGVTLAREIRKKSDAPLILLSSTGEIETGEVAGLFKFQIPKPIRQSILWDALQNVTGGATRDVPRPVVKRFDSTLAGRKPLRILLAEDNSVNQKVGRMMLNNLGYQPDVAANGYEVLDAVTTKNYDLIFMDIQMPGMDGVETVRRLREKLGDRSPHVVALTANALEGDREKFLGLGFDGYLSKPLSPESLQEALVGVTPPS
ncbi:MAG: response regulator, partial [Methylacidiphilales bacterium]|nr:response regulator [Candidatus Methylacidiphilales bacterium]